MSLALLGDFYFILGSYVNQIFIKILNSEICKMPY